MELETFIEYEVFKKFREDYVKNNFNDSLYSIFFSNPLNTLKPGKIYFLKLNHGGNSNGNYNEDSLDSYKEVKRIIAHIVMIIIGLIMENQNYN